jgi:tRNA pseudouridine55 synthase
MLLGRITDTGDRTGAVLEQRAVGEIDVARARDLAGEFTGVLEQVPPMVSAIKQGGTRLYDLARRGIEVERKPRVVEVHEFEIVSLVNDRIEFRIRCGRGTYVRALARDFGERLGPGACVESLRRTAVGAFTERQAVALTGPLEDQRARALGASVPLSAALAHMPSLKLQPEWVRRVRQGGQPPWRAVDANELPAGDRICLLGSEGELVAIASLSAVPGLADRPWRDSWELKLDRVL